MLVAISIPIFTSQLRKARVATDQANARAAKAAFIAYYLDDANTTSPVYYDTKSGTVVKDKPTEGEGKTTDAVGTDNIEGITGTNAQNLTTMVICGTHVAQSATTQETVTVTWVAK